MITACNTIPGVEEPDIYICSLIDNLTLECVNSYDDRVIKDITVIDAIGYQCISPKAFATIKTHHDVLHNLVKKRKHK